MATATKNKNDMMISGVFRDRSKANRVYDWLTNHGYASDEINVLMSSDTGRFYREESDGQNNVGSKAVEGVATGGTIGTVIGATLGAVAAIGTSILVPGLGVVVAGPIVAGLAGGGAGAVTGGLLGGLIGMGIPESNAAAYEAVLRDGGVVIGVVAHNSEERDEIEDLFEDMEAENVVITSA